jgi:hypothetical protein
VWASSSGKRQLAAPGITAQKQALTDWVEAIDMPHAQVAVADYRPAWWSPSFPTPTADCSAGVSATAKPRSPLCNTCSSASPAVPSATPAKLILHLPPGHQLLTEVLIDYAPY